MGLGFGDVRQAGLYHDKASVGFEIAWQFVDDVLDYHSPVFACVPRSFDNVLWLPVWWSWDVGRVCDDEVEALVFYGLVQVALLNVDVFQSICTRVHLKSQNGFGGSFGSKSEKRFCCGWVVTIYEIQEMAPFQLA